MAQQRYTITGFVIDEDTYDFKDTTTGNATTTESGFMSAADKVSLDDVVQEISNMYTKAETDAAISQATANRLLYVDASLTLANDSSAPKEYEIALSSYVPSGYVIQGVTACVKSGSAYYSLPWTDNGLTQYLNIQRIVGTSVWLRNKSDGWGTVTVRLSVAIGKT